MRNKILGLGFGFLGLAAAAVGQAQQAPSQMVDDIRDIRGPVPVESAWLWWVVGGLAALVILGAAVWWWKNRRRKVWKTADQEALELLEASRAWLDPQHAEKFTVRISEILRRYVERRYALHAPRRTTEEFLQDLRGTSEEALQPHQESLTRFLDACDMAKFARWSPSVDDMEELYASARGFVESTRPLPAKGGRRKKGRKQSVSKEGVMAS